MNPTPSTGAGRSQQDRSAATQAALLDATIDCLIELGHARTTTRLVAERAGVSRGAQTHHYPTKESLVVAAVERLFDRLARRFVASFRALPDAERTLSGAVQMLWSMVSGPAYAAVLEVIVAGRTEAQLGVVVHAVAADLEATIASLFAELFPDYDPVTAATLADVALTVVQGAAVSSYAGFGRPERTVALTGAVAAFITPESVDGIAALLAGAEASRPQTPDHTTEPTEPDREHP